MKLYPTMKSDLFCKLLLEPLYLLTSLMVVEALTLKLRFKAAILSLQNFYLRFRLGQTVKRKRKTLAHYIRERQLLQGITGGFKEAHISSPNSVISTNSVCHVSDITGKRQSPNASCLPSLILTSKAMMLRWR